MRRLICNRRINAGFNPYRFGAGQPRLARNEEAQLLSMSHSGLVAYQYAYGADGNRRWAKDIANNKWTWYPCGVACGAGELVEQGSDLTGATWATNAQYLRAGGGCSSMLIRRKSSTDDEYHHVDRLGTFGVVTGANGAVLSSRLYDRFLVIRGVSNITESAYITARDRSDYETIIKLANNSLFADRNLAVSAITVLDVNNELLEKCMAIVDSILEPEEAKCRRLRTKEAKVQCWMDVARTRADYYRKCHDAYDRYGESPIYHPISIGLPVVLPIPELPVIPIVTVPDPVIEFPLDPILI